MDVDKVSSVIMKSLLVFFVSFLIFAVYFVKKHYNYWKIRGIPYQKPNYLFGNLSFVMRKSFWDYLKELKKTQPSDYVGIFLGWTPALVVQSPELARKILVQDFEYFQDRHLYASPSDTLGVLNLFNLKNPMWTEMRSQLSPMFTASRLKSICELMNINAKALVNKIKREHFDEGKQIHLKELFLMYTTDTVAYSVFGQRVSILKDEISPLWFITNSMVKWSFRRGFEFTMIFLLPAVAQLLRLNFFSDGAAAYVKKMFWAVVESRKESSTTNNKDLLNHLLKLKQTCKLPVDANSQLADDLMMAQAAVFIFGSIETSTSTLCYCLYELAHHQHEQEKLYNEINDAMKSKGKDILEYDDLLELKYLTACVNETFRKHPVVAHLDRLCQKRYKLNDDVVIEAGVPVFINVVALHRDERKYPQPEQWRPERILNKSDNDNNDFSFLPFGDGPRFCIGKRYGMLQVRVAVAQLLHKYRVVPTDASKYHLESDPYSIFLSPKDSSCVKFILRQATD